MRRTRWNELLGIPNEIRYPSLYQLLALDEARLSDEAVESAFRSRMQLVQSLHSTKHKEFVEFVKGELRRALRVLTSSEELRVYDKDLAAERTEELERLLAPALAAGVLVGAAEKAILATAVLELGMSEKQALEVIERELGRAGAVRIDAPTLGPIPAEGLTNEAVAELTLAQAACLARLAEAAAARARAAQAAVEAPLSSSSDSILIPKKTKKKTKKSGRREAKADFAYVALEFCARCKVSIPGGWEKTGEAERIATRLLCKACAAPIVAGKACAGCSRALAWGEKTVSVGGMKRVCATCAAVGQKTKVCARCAVVLPQESFEKGEVVEREGRIFCRPCVAVG